MQRKHQIEIDSEVWAFLKQHAEPFEDTPNTVLRRLLLIKSGTNRTNSKTTEHVTDKERNTEMPSFPIGTPAALQQILEVTYMVINRGYLRTDATSFVAKRRGITNQSVTDKYCRQLGKQAEEIDLLLEHNLDGFKSLLIRRFPRYQDVIKSFFSKLVK